MGKDRLTWKLVSHPQKEQPCLHQLHTEWGENGVLTASPHLETNTGQQKGIEALPSKKWGTDCVTGASWGRCFVPLNLQQFALNLCQTVTQHYERFLGNSGDDTSGSNVHLAEHLMLNSDIEKQKLFRESMTSHSSHPESCPASLVMSLNTAPLITTTVKH